jgi:hypothetical protein
MKFSGRIASMVISMAVESIRPQGGQQHAQTAFLFFASADDFLSDAARTMVCQAIRYAFWLAV